LSSRDFETPDHVSGTFYVNILFFIFSAQ